MPYSFLVINSFFIIFLNTKHTRMTCTQNRVDLFLSTSLTVPCQPFVENWFVLFYCTFFSFSFTFKTILLSSLSLLPTHTLNTQGILCQQLRMKEDEEEVVMLFFAFTSSFSLLYSSTEYFDSLVRSTGFSSIIIVIKMMIMIVVCVYDTNGQSWEHRSLFLRTNTFFFLQFLFSSSSSAFQCYYFYYYSFNSV